MNVIRLKGFQTHTTETSKVFLANMRLIAVNAIDLKRAKCLRHNLKESGL